MTIKSEVQDLVDEIADEDGVYWHVALIRKGNRVVAMVINGRRGAKNKTGATFDRLLSFGKRKKLPVLTKILRSVGSKSFYTNRGFQQDPESRWGKLWFKLPGTTNRRNPTKKKKSPKAETEWIGLYESALKHIKGAGKTSLCGKIGPGQSGMVTSLGRHLDGRQVCQLCSKRRGRKGSKKKAVGKQFPPPFKRPTKTKLKKIILQHDLNIHENPPPADCPKCGMKYEDIKTGLTFSTVQDMLFVDTNDRDFWRQKGRHSVLGLWNEIKRSMWDDHLQMCGDQVAQEEYLEDFEY
jgi:hypothetical protein